MSIDARRPLLEGDNKDRRAGPTDARLKGYIAGAETGGENHVDLVEAWKSGREAVSR